MVKKNNLIEIVNEAGAGIVENSGDEEEPFNAVTRLVESEGMREEMGKKGR